MMMASSAYLASFAAPARILVINPNTNALVTARVREAAARIATPAVAFTVVNPVYGPHAIESTSDRDLAEPQVIQLLRSSVENDYDVCVMACFDDIAIDEAKSLTGRPVIGTAEAGIAAVQASVPGRFAIITTVVSALPVIHRLLARYTPDADCVVHAAGIGVAEAADAGAGAQARLKETIARAIRNDGAKAILLASGGLTGLAEGLAEEFGLPVIDGVVAAMLQAVTLTRPA
jgi:allantoin racemase